MSYENGFLTNIADKVSARINTIEIIAAVVFAAGLVLRSSNVPFDNVVLVISLSALALAYFLMSYRSSEPEAGVIKKFVDKLGCWSSSITVVGILFQLLNYPGFDSLLMVGCTTLAPALVFVIIKNHEFDKKTIIRIVMIVLIGGSLLLTPKEKLIEYKIIKKAEQTNVNY